MNGGIVWDAHTHKRTHTKDDFKLATRRVPFKEGPNVDETQFPAQKFHLLLFCQDFYSEAQEKTLQMSTNAYACTM